MRKELAHTFRLILGISLLGKKTDITITKLSYHIRNHADFGPVIEPGYHKV